MSVSWTISKPCSSQPATEGTQPPAGTVSVRGGSRGVTVSEGSAVTGVPTVAKVVGHDPRAISSQNLSDDRENSLWIHVLNRLRMDHRAKMCPESVHECVLETTTQERHAGIIPADIVSLVTIRREAGHVVPRRTQETEHPSHARARVQHRRLGTVDEFHQLFGVAKLGPVEVLEAHRLGALAGVVEIPVVKEVAGQHAVVQPQLGVRMHGRDAAVKAPTPDPTKDMMWQEGPAEDLAQNPGDAQPGRRSTLHVSQLPGTETELS